MSAKIKEAERAYSIQEVAELKGISPDFVRRAIRATEGNVLAAKMVGSRYRISASAVEAWWANLDDA